MKKWLLMLLSIMLIVAMALSMAACGSGSKDDDEEDYDMDSIAGEWEAKIDLGELSGMDFKLEVTVKLDCDEDGTYTITMDSDDILAAVEDNIDEIIEAALEQTGMDMSVDEFLDEAGMDRDEFIDMMAEELEYYEINESGEYTYEDEVLTIDGEEVECKYTGDKLTFEIEGIEFKFTR